MKGYEKELADLNRASELDGMKAAVIASRVLLYRLMERNQEAAIDSIRLLEPDVVWLRKDPRFDKWLEAFVEM